MGTLTIELPDHATQTEFNLRRWEELLADPLLANVEGRVEMDRHGTILMSPPAGTSHSSYQAEIGFLLRSLTRNGRVLTECPLSTADGVRAADVAWASPECLADAQRRSLLIKAPEICVEVRSPGNSDQEIKEKIELYFDAGAHEVWICNLSGEMTFFGRAGLIDQSKLCPDFPAKIVLR